MYEFTWKTIFLHSLVGRDEMLGSDIFGLTEQNALFQVTFPKLTPAQVSEALNEVDNSAYYLRKHESRYYASLEPTVNIALAKIRRSLGADQITLAMAMPPWFRHQRMDGCGRQALVAMTRMPRFAPAWARSLCPGLPPLLLRRCIR